MQYYGEGRYTYGEESYLQKNKKTQKFSGLQIRSQHSFFVVAPADRSGSPGVDKSGLIFLHSRTPNLHFFYMNLLLYKIASACYSSSNRGYIFLST